MIPSILAAATILLPLVSRPVRAEDAGPVELTPLVILGSRIESRPEGRTIGAVGRGDIDKTDAFNLKHLVDKIPGIIAKQSNGPRDVTLSIRGSGAKTSFGVRNIKMYEDWFPVTQSDGLSRTDLHDPNAYEGVDVIRGPSSSLYDNYAMGGVVNFRSRRARDIDGLDLGTAEGSFGYQNHYLHLGRQTGSLEHGLFGSLIRGDGYIRHSGFTTVTENFTAAYDIDKDRRLILKFVNNDLRAQVPSRLSRDQFHSDSRNAGTTSVTGVGTVSAEQAAQGRLDRRTIIGARYEQRLTPDTGFRFLGAYDVKQIQQTFGTIGVNNNPNFQQYADVTHEGTLLGLPARHYAGIFFNYMEQEAASFRNLADFEGTRGALQSDTRGHHQNLGARLREELTVAPAWKWIAGIGAERSEVKANVQTRTASETFSRVAVDRKFWNVAPETALVYQEHPDGPQARMRVAMGYGIPGISQLTTTPDGLAGNNTGLRPQRNVGFELGGAGTSFGMLSVDAAAYYELFYNEFVTQSPGAGLSSFTSNAPRSDHRGVELQAALRPACGLFASGAYTRNDQVYRTFSETLGPGDVRDRSGNKIPGVEEYLINARVGFAKRGLPGGWIELNRVSGFYVNNSNTLRSEPFTVFNANLNYSTTVGSSLKSVTVFLDVRNVFNLTYMASAVTVSDLSTDTPATLGAKQAFFAGEGRSFVGGLKLHF